MITLEQIKNLTQEVNDVVIVELGSGLNVSVKTKLPLEKKVELIEEIVVACSYGTDPYFNPLKLKTITSIKVLAATTDIDILSDEEVNIYDLYDLLNSTGVFSQILPLTEYQEILNWAHECSEALISYNNSIMGIVAEIKDKFNAEDLQEQLLNTLNEIKNNPEVSNLLELYKSEGLLDN